MVVISFSIIVSCVLISLLLVIVGILYSNMGSNISVANSILFDGENISFEPNFVMYINSTIIPTIMIMNRIYQNQYLLYIGPLIKRIIVVCNNNNNNNISPCVLKSFTTFFLSLIAVFKKPPHNRQLNISASKCFP